MAKFDRKVITGVYEEILRKKFEKAFDWEKPEIVETVGPFTPEVFEVYEELLLTLLHGCCEQFKRQFVIFSDYDKIKSGDLLQWVKHVDLDIHPKALSTLERFHGEPTKSLELQTREAPGKRPDKRELDSIASLFTAVAIEQFGYDPTAKRSPTIKEIQNLAASLGIEMSDDTIRSYLRHGTKFIDPDWKPHER